MNPKVTLGLVILLVVLAVYIFFFEVRGENGRKDADDNLIRIYGTETYDEYDVVELEIVGSRGSAHFARTNETLTQDWEMLSPTPLSPATLDQVRVNGAATRLARLTASQVITNVSDLAQYGLDPPDLTVTLTISNGRKIVLYTGAETPINDDRYIHTTVDDASVYSVFGLAIDELHRLIDEPPLAPTPLPTLTSSPAP